MTNDPPMLACCCAECGAHVCDTTLDDVEHACERHYQVPNARGSWEYVSRSDFLRDLDTRISSYVAEHPEGGSLHIVLSDDNWEREHVIWCEGVAHGRDDRDGYYIASMLQKLTESERRAWSDNDWTCPDERGES